MLPHPTSCGRVAVSYVSLENIAACEHSLFSSIILIFFLWFLFLIVSLFEKKCFNRINFDSKVQPQFTQATTSAA